MAKFEDLSAATVGQANIRDDQIGPWRIGEFATSSVHCGSRGNGEAFEPKAIRERYTHEFVILDDENRVNPVRPVAWQA